MYEQSLRVPMIIYDPRIPATKRGKVTSSPGLNIDVEPTILDLAGIPVPAGCQGISLVPLVNNEKVASREFMLFEHLWDFVNIPQSECVRSNGYKLIRYPQHPGYEEFYDLNKDPDEVNSLMKDPASSVLIQQYRVKLDSLIGVVSRDK